MNKIVFTFLLLSLAGCSQEEDIRRALEGYVSSQPAACFVFGKWPFEETFGGDPPVNLEQSHWLEKHGFATFERTVYWFKGNLTDRGRALYRENVKTTRFGSSIRTSGLCFGKRKLVKLLQYTEPAAMFGKTVTEATYSWTSEEIPDWVNEHKLVETYPNLPRNFRLSDVTIQVLQKTNQGWQAINLN